MDGIPKIPTWMPEMVDSTKTYQVILVHRHNKVWKLAKCGNADCIDCILITLTPSLSYLHPPWPINIFLCLTFCGCYCLEISPDLSSIPYVFEDDLEPLILFLPLFKCWDDRYIPQGPVLIFGFVSETSWVLCSVYPDFSSATRS